MAKSGADIIKIVRQVTGRTDSSDPQFTDAIMMSRVNDYLELIMPQEVRLYENKTWWEFTFNAASDGTDTVPVDLEVEGFSTIGPLAYIGPSTDVGPGFKLWWFQDPASFYGKWPDTQTFTEQRPTDVLYYNNELLFRGPPDQPYQVRIEAYKIEARITEGTNIDEAYFWRYVAYGTALDIFSDFGEMDKYNEYMPAFRRYKALVYARTNQQNRSQRTVPDIPYSNDAYSGYYP